MFIEGIGDESGSWRSSIGQSEIDSSGSHRRTRSRHGAVLCRLQPVALPWALTCSVRVVIGVGHSRSTKGSSPRLFLRRQRDLISSSSQRASSRKNLATSENSRGGGRAAGHADGTAGAGEGVVQSAAVLK